MSQILHKYFIIKTDELITTTDKISFEYLELKPKVISYYEMPNENFKNQLKNRISQDNEGLYYKDFYICFTYNKGLYYIKHHHENDKFIKDIVEILKYNNAKDIFIKYGELD